MYAVLLRDYRTQYRDPVRFSRGEPVTLGARDTEWPEFIWATDAAGRSGWVHERYLDGDRGTVAAARDYTARELDADAGERVRLIEEAGGWWWAENDRGAQGWLPARDLSMEQERGDA
ncbi:MAG TPA: SH3 domain-containing protein [Tahibacter sp.]|uniref:SH3 domain-containing protein n=1 Tax=Tahibacter sp. TaxID=2056211 RepID=UPI002C4C3BB4|nr:SH3 domain-containing protein [Tahibacter sp.]HSX60552.1 SH3 domain-containing protein [Tahibacter sp.]